MGWGRGNGRGRARWRSDCSRRLLDNMWRMIQIGAISISQTHHQITQSSPSHHISPRETHSSNNPIINYTAYPTIPAALTPAQPSPATYTTPRQTIIPYIPHSWSMYDDHHRSPTSAFALVPIGSPPAKHPPRRAHKAGRKQFPLLILEKKRLSVKTQKLFSGARPWYEEKRREVNRSEGNLCKNKEVPSAGCNAEICCTGSERRGKERRTYVLEEWNESLEDRSCIIVFLDRPGLGVISSYFRPGELRLGSWGSGPVACSGLWCRS